MNKSNIQFIDICKPTQNVLREFLSEYLDNTIRGEKYIYRQGTFPVLLVAHLDTVHKSTPTEIYYDKKNKAYYSPQGIGGDDRCGVYMILKILQKYDCSVVFCEDEEVGGKGAKEFATEIAKHKLKLNYIIEFDRMGENDAVFYDCVNADFENFITKEFYKTKWGTYSDICEIAPTLGIAAVNLSCGYHNPHTINEYVVVPEMERSIEEACKILARTTSEDKFEYIEAEYYDYTDNPYNSFFVFEYADESERICTAYEYGLTEADAVGKLLMKHPNLCYNDILSTQEENW